MFLTGTCLSTGFLSLFPFGSEIVEDFERIGGSWYGSLALTLHKLEE